MSPGGGIVLSDDCSVNKTGRLLEVHLFQVFSCSFAAYVCTRAVKVGFKNRGFSFFLNLKISKNPNFRFFKTYKPQVTSPNFSFFTRVTNLIQMVFKYELRFVAFTWPNLCSWVVIL